MNLFKIYFLSSSIEPTNIRYIGITKQTLNARLCKHINISKQLKNYKDCWIQKHLKLNNTILITELENVSTEELAKQKEIFYIKYYRDLGNKLTNSTGGGDGLNLPSEETKKKLLGIIPWNKGKKHSIESREKMSKAGKGKPKSKEHKEKIKKANTGKKFTKEHIENLKYSMKAATEYRKIHNIPHSHTGRKVSESTKEKQKQSHLGKILSEETRAKMKAAAIINKENRLKNNINHPNKGKKLSEEHKQKISLAGKGRKKSEEHKQKISKAHIERAYLKSTKKSI